MLHLIHLYLFHSYRIYLLFYLSLLEDWLYLRFLIIAFLRFVRCIADFKKERIGFMGIYYECFWIIGLIAVLHHIIVDNVLEYQVYTYHFLCNRCNLPLYILSIANIINNKYKEARQ